MPATSQQTNADKRWMAAALDQAKRGVGFTSPNPPVGAVIVRDDAIIGQGYHRKAGEPHAEVEAIRDAATRFPKLLPGSTLYVTLEPCSTQGRTPPCTEAIKAARISRLVYGTMDPNPKHAGRVNEALQGSKVEVVHGVLDEECREIIRPFSKWITTGIPYVIAKAGQSLDGRITRPPGESQWITSEAARTHGRRLRMRVDAIIVGAETVRRDDPALTLRVGSAAQGKTQPWRVVMTRSGVLPPTAKIFTDEHRDRTLVMRGLDYPEVLRELGARGVLSVLIEGGGIILGRAFATQMIDEVYWYVAPRFCGGGRPSIAGMPLAASVGLDPVKVLPIGDNVCFVGHPVWSSTPTQPPPLPVIS
jgi:diaminohydroxyphosphoribosylaminopyrimidine deaminase / 5-amino-6-(5-phosphoribosylamino)uracil reductase